MERALKAGRARQPQRTRRQQHRTAEGVDVEREVEARCALIGANDLAESDHVRGRRGDRRAAQRVQ